jgi:hypothetical protein
MATISQLRAGVEHEINAGRAAVEAILTAAEREGRKNLTATEEARAESLFAKIERNKSKLDALKGIEAEEAEVERRFNNVTYVKRNKPHYDEVMRIGSEPRTYSRDNDPEGKGVSFLTDVVGAFRGSPQSMERLARHNREYEVDNKGRATRAAGDVATGALPNLIIPQYLVDLYAAKPSAARPFADICRHEDLPAEGMKVELAKGNTSATAALQTSELVAAGGGNFDADPLELSVQTAEAWQLVSRQAIDRGRVTESVVMGDMLDQMAALLDSTLISQGTTGLFASGTRITYDSASPTVAEMYPYILQGASKSAQTLLNRGKPTHVLMHPRRWYWLQSLVDSKWPVISAPGMGQVFGASNGGGYEDGGMLPCGLRVVQDANVQTAALAAADTGGTQDIIYIVPQNEAILFEAPQREVFIRAEAPAANQLGVMLVVYEYFAYSFSRYAATAFQRINGTGTVPPAGF